MSESRLRWLLCDARGAQIDVLEDRLAAQVQLALNSARSGTVELGIEHPAVKLVRSMETRLKCYLGQELILNGEVFLPDFAGSTADQMGTLTLSAVDNMQLQAAYTKDFQSFTNGLANAQTLDQSEFMAQLMEQADANRAAGVPSHGIIRGNLPASAQRTLPYYDGANVWESIIEIAALLGGADFELEPLDRTDGIFMQLNTYPSRQGSDKSQLVRLEFGLGAHNASEFNYQPSGEQLINRYFMAGATPEAVQSTPVDINQPTPVWVSENLDSQQRHGVYAAMEIDTSLVDGQQLKDRADLVVAQRSWPQEFFDATPAVEQGGTAVGWARDAGGFLTQLQEGYGVPPRFAPDGDYWLGDTITAIAREAGIDRQLSGRVTSATITQIDQAGNVVVELEFAPPAQAASISGYATTMWLSAADQVTDDGGGEDGSGSAVDNSARIAKLKKKRRHLWHRIHQINKKMHRHPGPDPGLRKKKHKLEGKIGAASTEIEQLGGDPAYGHHGGKGGKGGKKRR